MNLEKESQSNTVEIFWLKLFDSGELKAFVKAELPMEEADHAYSGSIAGNPGKLIIRTTTK
jgi:hypothetical protein